MRTDRPLMAAGGILLVALGLLAVLVPSVLLHEPDLVPSQPTRERPPSDARLDAVGEPPTATQPAPESTAPNDQATARRPTPPRPSDPSVTPAADRGSGEATVERRRVQPGPEPSPAARPPPSARSADRGEWDRSAAARERGIRTFGGTRQTESAVAAGLAWLAAHQSPDGRWDRVAFGRQCPENDRCLGPALQRLESDLDPGVTGLALLAFLGAGHTDLDGPYKQTVAKAVDVLLRMQVPAGGFSADESMAGYNDALATLALAEYYALTREARVRKPLDQAIAAIVRSQQPRGGWDYGRSPTSGRNDTSITAWMVQALHACEAAGLEIPRETLVRAALHFHRAAEPDGQVRYADAGSGFTLQENLRPKYQYGSGMTAAGLMCEQLLGWRTQQKLAIAQCGRLRADLPSAAGLQGRRSEFHTEYYWYYGTLAMFQRGGDDWSTWNARLRDAILPLQNRDATADGRKRHAHGSWQAYAQNWGLFGRMGGRIYTTAICTLTLEIYYRHTPAFLVDQVLFTPDDWRAYASRADERERREIAGCLGRLRAEIGEPVLVELLEDASGDVALAAAEALAGIDSPMGVAVLERAVATRSPSERPALARALERARAVAALPAVEGRVRFFDAPSGLATLDLPRCYVGMRLRVERDGRAIAHLRIVQRYDAYRIAIAVWLAQESGSPPAAGDRVIQPI